MNEEINKTMHLLRHHLDTLKADLKRPPERWTCRQRVENCAALLEMLERQITEAVE
jgi:hypothetical protein